MAEAAERNEDWPPLELDVSHLVTEDDEPVDNFFQDKQMNLLTDSLATSWSGARPFLTASDVGIFSTLQDPPLVPDMLLSMGVEFPSDILAKKHRSYYLWHFGKPPDLVIEVVSNAKGGEDTTKLTGYARIKVPYYVIYDPEKILGTRPLRVFQLSPLDYVEQVGAALPGLGLKLTVWNGLYDGLQADWLRWTDKAGNLLLTGQEASLQANNQARAAEEQTRAAEERVRKLEQALREAGIQLPES